MKLKKLVRFALAVFAVGVGTTTAVTLTACTESIYTITFESNGGTEIESITTGTDGKISVPTNPTKEGYVFAGWYSDSELTTRVYPATQVFNSNTTLYAKWIEKLADVDSYATVSDYRAYAMYDLDALYTKLSSAITDTSVLGLLTNAYQDGIIALETANTFTSVDSAFESAKSNMAIAIPTADGVFDYTALSTEEKTEILGLLESYAVDNGLTGLSLYENGGYYMYNTRVQLGTENYISGYGFGTLAEGKPTAALTTESNTDWQYYYHTVNASDPGTANYLNDKGSEVASFYSYFAASFYTTFMNSTKDGYDWTPELAKELPQAVDPDESGMSKTWRFQVRTGETDGLKYSTLSTKSDRSNYNNRNVELEDYETAFKLLLTQSNGLYRGAELASSTTGAIKGASSYYAGTQNYAMGSNEAEELWNSVGIKTYTEDGKNYFEVEFTSKLTEFYAMYYISSSLYQPVPMDFLTAVGTTDGVTNYLGYNSDKDYTPVDNSLSLGAFVLETWETDKQIVYKKNTNYVYTDTKYQWAGVKITVLPAITTDSEAAFKEFINGNIDGCSIPQTKLSEYKSDERTRKALGDSVFKLNVNACDQETWNELFGVNGTVTQTKESEYWECEPALSNSYFVQGLSYAINRVEFADARGYIASVDYLSSDYLSDPVNGISYSTTEAHKNAVAKLLEDTDGYGYSLEMAREYFKIAISQLEAEGKYTPGTAENPTEITLEIAWMYPQNEEKLHNEIKKYLEDAFNDDSVSGGKYILKVEFWVGDNWYDVYYDKLLVGQYDIGFGSISGNSLDPLTFMEVLSSDQNISGEFTLNWGVNTNDVDSDILVYNGYRFSYDALYMAATSGAAVKDGELVSIFDSAETTAVDTTSSDENVTLTIEVKFNSSDNYYGEVTDFVIFGYDSSADYEEHSIYYVLDESGEATSELTGNVVLKETKDDGTLVYTVTLTKAVYDAYVAKGTKGIYVYYKTHIGADITTSSLQTVYLVIAE